MTTHLHPVLRNVLCRATIVAHVLVSGCVGEADLDEPTGTSDDTDPRSTDDSSSSGDDISASMSSTSAEDGGTSAGPSPVTPEEACAAYCEYALMCWDAAEGECMPDCLQQHSLYDEVSPECDLAAETYVDCIAEAAECSESNCVVPALAVGACEGMWSCSTAVNGLIGSEGCTWELDCDYLDELRTIECDGETCTCLEDGNPTGECAASIGVCTDDFGAATECCGWTNAFGDPV